MNGLLTDDIPIEHVIADLAERLASAALQALDRLRSAVFPDWEIPRQLACVGMHPGCHVDLAYVLTLLRQQGLSLPAGSSEPDLARILSGVQCQLVDTFWSYRLAFTLRAFGPAGSNSLLAGFPRRSRGDLVKACDSTGTLRRVGVDLPQNFAFVLARCEYERWLLGTATHQELAVAVAECLSRFAGASPYIIDDSTARRGRFDNYSLDALLVCEPLSGMLEPGWSLHLDQALSLVSSTFSHYGEAIPWGRSTGPMATAVGLQIAALGVGAGKPADCLAWCRRMHISLDVLCHALKSGLIGTLRTGGSDSYRGLERWAQMTLDIIAKMLEARLLLTRSAAAGTRGPAVIPGRQVSRLIPLSAQGCYAWAYQDNAHSFVVPFMGGHTAEYMAVPFAPGHWILPADSSIALMTPVVVRSAKRYCCVDAPDDVTLSGSGVRARWSAFGRLGLARGERDILAVARLSEFHPERLGITVSEQISNLSDTDTVALALGAPAADAISLEVDCRENITLAHQRVTDVSGIPELRGRWGGAAEVIEVELSPAGPEVSFTWTVRRKPVVHVSGASHPYSQALYSRLRGGVRVLSARGADGQPRVSPCDIVHMNWPEWAFGWDGELSRHRQFLDMMRAHDTAIAWTAHNLFPHLRAGAPDPLYELWAAEADVVLHHSKWGERIMTGTYDFRPGARHYIVPHICPDRALLKQVTRSEAESRLSLPHAPIRLLIIGGSRPGRDPGIVADALSKLRRDDLQLLVCGPMAVDLRPADKRIIVRPGGFLERSQFDLCLDSADALVVPQWGDFFLTSGLLAEAVARGLPVIHPSWGYAEEYLQGKGLSLGDGPESVCALLESINCEILQAAAKQTHDLYDYYTADTVSETLKEIIDMAIARR